MAFLDESSGEEPGQLDLGLDHLMLTMARLALCTPYPGSSGLEQMGLRIFEQTSDSVLKENDGRDHYEHDFFEARS